MGIQSGKVASNLLVLSLELGSVVIAAEVKEFVHIAS